MTFLVFLPLVISFYIYRTGWDFTYWAYKAVAVPLSLYIGYVSLRYISYATGERDLIGATAWIFQGIALFILISAYGKKSSPQ